MVRTSQSTRPASRRRRFGKIERKVGANGQISYDASYIPPVEARSQDPHLPARIHKRFDEVDLGGSMAQRGKAVD